MKYPIIKRGDRNLAVRAAQNAVKRALKKRGIKHEAPRTGSFDAATVANMNRFENAFNIRPVSGSIVDQKTWNKLAHFMGSIDRAYVRRYNVQVRKRMELQAQRKQRDEKTALRARIVSTAIAFFNSSAASYVYSQFRPMPDSIYSDEARNRLDCSSSVTLIFKRAGAKDPNGLGYNGAGWTGTLIGQGSRTNAPRGGDLAFYGNAFGRTGHVALHLDSVRIFSFGSTPMRIWPTYRYRSDYDHSRSYI